MLVQAYRDFCHSEADASRVAEWLLTEDFDYVCNVSHVDADRALDAFKNLARYDFPLRNRLMKDTISATVGGAPSTKNEAERD